jgi:Reversibly glycosylated polypeptide
MARTSDTALVIPSIRKDSFQRFVDEWRSTGLFNRVDVILMEDNPERTFAGLTGEMMNYGDNITHLCWEDIDKHEWSWIIPRRSDTVRSFGYLRAFNEGYDYLMTLDDDCYPNPDYPNLDELHKSMLTRTKWFNTLNNVRPRGVPYMNLGERKVHINHGIWTGILDYDAPQQLVNPVPEVYSHDNRIVPSGAYHPFCGMNAMWRREVMVLSYHLLMGKWKPTMVMDGSEDKDLLCALPFDRFGDIWCGIIQKKICDHLGYAVSTGTPYIHHDRASSPFTNLRKEANGIEVNEWFWKKIDDIDFGTMGRGTFATPASLYKEVGNNIRRFGGEHDGYWLRLGDAMVTWAELFEGKK